MTTTMTYEDVADRLGPDAIELFKDMVTAHLESSGDSMFILADHMGGTMMLFTGGGSRRTFEDFDGGAIEDLLTFGLLHINWSSRGTPNYRVAGQGVHFHRWLIEREGSAIDQVDEQVNRLVAGDDFAATHPGAAHHLSEAFGLLWDGQTDLQATSEIGDHLRKALMDVATDLVGPDAGGSQERPVERLRTWVGSQEAATREIAVLERLVDLAEATLRLDHRLNHVRDEIDRDAQPVTWPEIRRAAFTTAFVCSELHELAS